GGALPPLFRSAIGLGSEDLGRGRLQSSRGPADGPARRPRRGIPRGEPEARVRLRAVSAAAARRAPDLAKPEAAAVRVRARSRRRAGPARLRAARGPPPAGVRRIDDVSLLRGLLPDEPHD